MWSGEGKNTIIWNDVLKVTKEIITDSIIAVNSEFTNLKVDHIAEKTAGHNVVFDNDVQRINVVLSGSGLSSTALRLTGRTGDFTKGVVLHNTIDAVFPYTDGFLSLGVDVGENTFRWKDLYLSGDANIGGDIVVGGSVDGVDIAGQAVFVIDAYNHISADGSSHSKVNTAISHISATGASHSYINQAVTSTSNPSFNKIILPTSAGATTGINFLGLDQWIYSNSGDDTIYFINGEGGSVYDFIFEGTVGGTSFSEMTNTYDYDIDLGKEDLTEWVTGKHPIRLSHNKKITTSTDLGKAGKATAKIVLNLLDEIEALKARIEVLEK